jgi:hypothetical protein
MRKSFNTLHLTSLPCFLAFCLAFPSYAALGNNISENQRQFGREVISKQFSDGWRDFSGKKVYELPLFGWQVEVLYRDGKSYSETARPKGNKVKKNLLAEQEANVIADVLYPKEDRGGYRKQVKNANFVSHFFEHGLVSYEMQLDKKRRNYVGIAGVRTVLYSDGAMFREIMINAYQ